MQVQAAGCAYIVRSGKAVHSTSLLETCMCFFRFGGSRSDPFSHGMVVWTNPAR